MDLSERVAGAADQAKKRPGHYTHGLSYSSEYRAWHAMRTRCGNPKAINYPRYGGVGVRVCERWRSFTNFYADVGQKPSPQHSLDRIDNAKGYEPGNVRWATRSEQASNRKVCRMFTVDGETLCLAEICRRRSVNYDRTLLRIGRLGWSIERALEQKSQQDHG